MYRSCISYLYSLTEKIYICIIANRYSNLHKKDWTSKIVQSNTNSDPAHIKEKISIQNWIFVQFSISRLLLPPKPARNQPGVSRICTIMPQALGEFNNDFSILWWIFLVKISQKCKELGEHFRNILLASKHAL